MTALRPRVRRRARVRRCLVRHACVQYRRHHAEHEEPAAWTAQGRKPPTRRARCQRALTRSTAGSFALTANTGDGRDLRPAMTARRGGRPKRRQYWRIRIQCATLRLESRPVRAPSMPIRVNSWLKPPRHGRRRPAIHEPQARGGRKGPPNPAWWPGQAAPSGCPGDNERDLFAPLSESAAEALALHRSDNKSLPPPTSYSASGASAPNSPKDSGRSWMTVGGHSRVKSVEQRS